MSIRPVVHVMSTLLGNFPLSILVKLVFKADILQYGFSLQSAVRSKMILLRKVQERKKKNIEKNRPDGYWVDLIGTL